MSNGEGSIKKRLCNPPAEQIACHGDYEVAGLFKGAGRVLDADDHGEDHKKAMNDFRDEMIVIEQSYVKDRKSLAYKYVKLCHESYDKLLAAVGYKGPSGY